MKSIAALASFLAVAAPLAAQSEVLYYKFEGGGAKALNYALGSPAPGEGPITNTLTTAPVESFVPGPFGDALTSGIAVTPYQANWVTTGWAPNVTGDYTWAMWLRNSRGGAGPSLTYIAGIPTSGAFRIYSGSSILLTVGGAGGTTYYSTNANVYQLATAGWVHVAFVVDTATMTATYYINGVPEAPDPLTAMPNISGSGFHIGRQTLTNAPSVYDIDEFRFLTRAASASEVQAWASQNGAGFSAFGAGCGGGLAAANGLPQLGNLAFAVDVTSNAPNAIGVLAFGGSRTAWGALPLPLDLGLVFGAPLAGCQLECSPDVTATVVLGPGGAAQVPFPIPALPGLDGQSFYAQGLLLGGPGGLSTTNPAALAIGN